MNSNRYYFLFFSCIFSCIFSQSIDYEMKFDTACFDFDVNVLNSNGKENNYKVSLQVHKLNNVYKYYNHNDKKALVFSDSIKGVELTSEVDTLLYIHYYVRKYGFESLWAKSFIPYTICSKRKKKLGECIYNYFYSFYLFGSNWNAFFSMQKGAIIKMNLSLDSREKAKIISNSRPLFR